MTHAYPETYLNDAMDNLGNVFDYAVHDCHRELNDFYSMFLVSGVARAFGKGAPKYIAGFSGPELADEVFFRDRGAAHKRRHILEHRQKPGILGRMDFGVLPMAYGDGICPAARTRHYHRPLAQPVFHAARSRCRQIRRVSG